MPYISVSATAGRATTIPVTRPLRTTWAVMVLSGLVRPGRVGVIGLKSLGPPGSSKIELVEIVFCQNVIGRREQAGRAVDQHAGHVGDAQRFLDVLFDHDHGDAPRIDRLHLIEDLGNESPRDARGRY